MAAISIIDIPQFYQLNSLDQILEPDQQALQDDPRISRNFERLIMERNGVQEEIDKSLYSQVFNEIKNKIFSMNEIEDIPKISDTQHEELNKKYYTADLNSTIQRIKKLLVNNFNKKIELEITLEENKKKFEEFTGTINKLIFSINGTPNTSEEDIALKDLLIGRINWYYSTLQLDQLKKEYSEILIEYSFFKDLLKSISEVSPGGTCGICLDRQVSWFIDPCGHTLCDLCKDQTKNLGKCHFCRTRKNTLKRLFI